VAYQARQALEALAGLRAPPGLQARVGLQARQAVRELQAWTEPGDPRELLERKGRSGSPEKGAESVELVLPELPAPRVLQGLPELAA